MNEDRALSFSDLNPLQLKKTVRDVSGIVPLFERFHPDFISRARAPHWPKISKEEEFRPVSGGLNCRRV